MPRYERVRQQLVSETALLRGSSSERSHSPPNLAIGHRYAKVLKMPLPPWACSGPIRCDRIGERRGETDHSSPLHVSVANLRSEDRQDSVARALILRPTRCGRTLARGFRGRKSYAARSPGRRQYDSAGESPAE